MWYLVVPPIIVVCSLFFLLWYLLRREADPVVAERMLESERARGIILPRIKRVCLKMVEKFAQRFKVELLRAHNGLNEFTQSVKKMRATAELTTPAVSKAGTPAFSEDERPSEGSTDPSNGLLQTPFSRRERNESVRKEITEVSEQKILVPRPIVSDAVTHPEIEKRSWRKESPREEGLIARIARDPKDFTAYEELGDYYLEAGNIKDAKECYRQVLKLSPVHRLVKIKIRRLEKLLTRSGE